MHNSLVPIVCSYTQYLFAICTHTEHACIVVDVHNQNLCVCMHIYLADYTLFTYLLCLWCKGHTQSGHQLINKQHYDYGEMNVAS